MALGVHLPGCPCARCQACIAIIARVNQGQHVRDAEAIKAVQDASIPKWRRDPWADSGGEDE